MPPAAAIDALLAPFEVEHLDADPSTIYALDAALRIAYFNPGWAEFARANGARWRADRWGLGASVLDAVSAELRPFYESLFERAQHTRGPVEHVYECSSATQHRRFHMRVAPCGEDALLVVHSLSEAGLHALPSSAPREGLYRVASGVMTQCSHCRRVRRVDGADYAHAQWDWVPDYVAQIPPRTSHGLCSLCHDYYYPK